MGTINTVHHRNTPPPLFLLLRPYHWSLTWTHRCSHWNLFFFHKVAAVDLPRYACHDWNLCCLDPRRHQVCGRKVRLNGLSESKESPSVGQTLSVLSAFLVVALVVFERGSAFSSLKLFFSVSPTVNGPDFCVATFNETNSTCQSWTYGEVTELDLTLVRDFDLVCSQDTITMLINTLYIVGRNRSTLFRIVFPMWHRSRVQILVPMTLFLPLDTKNMYVFFNVYYVIEEKFCFFI